MDYEGFKLEKMEGVAVLTLNRPDRLNALTEKMLGVAVPEVLEELNRDDGTRVLIITGVGKGFCAGADVSELGAMTQLPADWKRHDKLQPLGGFALLLYNMEKPVIAAVNGIAAGAGFSLALLSDIRIASENARFMMAVVGRGLVPDCGATFLLPRLIGEARSFELMYTGDIINAKEAERIGIVNKVVPHDNLMDEAMALAKRLAKGPALTLAQIRRAVHAGVLNNLEQQLYFESYAQNFCFGTEDCKEGINSFLEKREAKFKGK